MGKLGLCPPRLEILAEHPIHRIPKVQPRTLDLAEHHPNASHFSYMMTGRKKRTRDDYYEETENHDPLRYTIARKLKIDHLIEARETEQDLVVAPREYWEMFETEN
ncbi:hypothetical protein BP00DRAFT_478878 [Aspergillus indologenus CBS 114.80]|uniref:Uncharacterized protein n=1 Tax=Aspergillus indologenus CBS 114.80 TaxID=1450541 RepID=A0A2V5ILZ1_9EURO|nr:hypothetical protein BP00DRAFT_478878 [Aspergillus indologenus CBS 114.80]